MIASLTGTLAAKTPNAVIIDVGGVGYEVSMAGSAIVGLPAVGSRVTVLTHLQVREDDMSLIGFTTAAEKSAFRALIGVSGVGPRVALGVLSALSPDRLADAIAREDVTVICEAPGVGKKLAQRLIVELRDKLDAPDLVAAPGAAAGPAGVEARDALVAMGFSAAEASAAVKGAPEGATVEETVTFGLRRIGAGG
jgi:Holliday junction DNA helicase RuvA